MPTMVISLTAIVRLAVTVLVSAALCSATSARWQPVAGRRPYELILNYTDTPLKECLLLSVRQVPFYRGLLDVPGESIVTSKPLPVPHPHSRSGVAQPKMLRIYSFEVPTARAKAEAICGTVHGLGHWRLHGGPFAQSKVITATTEQRSFTFSATVGGDTPPPPPLLIQSLSFSGPSENRVDLVFFSDGYTFEESGKFFKDATRLAADISSNQTFNTVAPLLNFWAAFSPSKESGIGVGGTPKDTVFGLYRDGTELRGVYYSKPELARAACSSMGDRCDYPILLGNDPLYGGLGGQFTVITSSLANGPLVLRHELGHSIIDVGEEYDGGYAYFGVNAAESASAPVTWAHWMAESDRADPPRVEKSVMPLQEYPWTLLNTSSPWLISFLSSGLYSRRVLRFSLSGIPEGSDLLISVDNTTVDWIPQPGIGVDRWHYDIHYNAGFSEGKHEVAFTLLNPNLEGTAQLCSVEVLEFGDEDEFRAQSGYIGLFPTFSETNETTYRPTNEDCLMRVVTSPNFCKVCSEGLWMSLMRRVELIDDVRSYCVQGSHLSLAGNGEVTTQWTRTIELALVPLAKLRKGPAVPGESYEIIWSKAGKVLDAFTNKTRLEIDDEGGFGTFDIDVRFSTEEVRVDPDNLFTSAGSYEVVRRCRDRHIPNALLH